MLVTGGARLEIESPGGFTWGGVWGMARVTRVGLGRAGTRGEEEEGGDGGGGGETEEGRIRGAQEPRLCTAPLTLCGVFAQCACSSSSTRSPHPRHSRGLFSPRSARVLMLVSIYNLCDIVNCAPSHPTKAQESNFKIISPCSVCAGE